MRRSVLIAAVLVALALPAAGSAGAQTVPDVLAGRSVEPRGPDVAVNGSGRAVAVWTARSEGGFAVLARTRDTRGRLWRPAVRISEVTPERPLAPAVALGGDGTAVALWRLAGGPVQAAALAPGAAAGSWVRATLGSDGEGLASPAVAAGAGGATVAWADRLDGAWRVHRGLLRDGAWRLDQPLDLEDAGIVTGDAADLPPALAVNARGDAALAWPRRPFASGVAGEPAPGPTGPVSPAPVSVALRPDAAGGWERATVLSERGSHADVALGPAGHAGAVWVDERATLAAAVREPEADAWPAPEPLGGGAGAVPSFPRVAIDEEGYALAGWAATAGSELSVRARTRSGASGLWGAERTVDDDFAFFSILDLATLEAVIDDQRRGHLAWFDPEGPGSASVHVASGDSAGGWRDAVQVGVGEDLNEPALAVSVRGGSVLVTPRALAIGAPNVELVAAAFPEPPRFTLSAAQLRINQRISQAAVRRVNAALARLEGGLRAEHIRDGTLEASDFGPGVRVVGTPSGVAPPPPTPAPLEVAPPRPGPPGALRLSVAQLRINQRISQAAVERSNLGRALFDAGLTGRHVVDGAVGAAKLLAGLRVAEATPVDEPLPPSPELVPGPRRGGGAVTLTALQLQINQRISQAAVLRANWLVEKLEAGVRGRDVREGGLRAEDLATEPRTG